VSIAYLLTLAKIVSVRSTARNTGMSMTSFLTILSRHLLSFGKKETHVGVCQVPTSLLITDENDQSNNSMH
jgi:hypothetical protein